MADETESVSREEFEKLQKQVRKMMPSRRDVLKGSAVLGAGAMLGSGGSGSAAASTGNAGPIGTASDRPTIYGDDVDANSVNTGDLQGTYPGKLRAIADGQVLETIEVSNTTTPVQDAIDVINGHSRPYGRVLLPPSRFTEASSIDMGGCRSIDIVGWSRQTTIEFTDDTAPAFIWSDTKRCTLSDFRVLGSLSGTSQPVIQMDDSFTGGSNFKILGNVFDRVEIQNWYGPFIEATGGDSPFENSFGQDYIEMSSIDAGDATALIDWSQGGRANSFGTLAVYPDDSQSGTDTNIYDDTGGSESSAYFRWLNLGGTTGAIADVDGGLVIQSCNYEPAGKNSDHDLITLRQGRPRRVINHLETQGSPTINTYYRIRGGGNSWLCQPWTRSTYNVTENNVVIADSPASYRLVYYEGTDSQITDNSGESNNSVRALASAGTGNG